METRPPRSISPWLWVPTLYFAEGLPNAVVVSLAAVMFKNLGLSNTAIAGYTSLLYWPWVIKPLWSPIVDLLGRKRRWIVALQCALGLLFGAVALALFSSGSGWIAPVLVLLWLMAFASATHDIAADGFYLDALQSDQQAAFVGVRSTFFRLATLAGKGGLVSLSGALIVATGAVAQGWSVIFALLAGGFLLAGLLHQFSLPTTQPEPVAGTRSPADFGKVLGAFFAKPQIGTLLFFLLTFRLAEALALKLVEPFLLDPHVAGGLGLSNQQEGFAYGFTGTAALLVGGLLGGWLIARRGLRRTLWPMLLATHVPLGVFFLLAKFPPGELSLISAALGLEQFGYGFGFTAYMVVMMRFAEGEHRTAHYAVCTGFMALGLMLPGYAAGWLQEHLGYANFFALTLLAAVPSCFAVARIRAKLVTSNP